MSDYVIGQIYIDRLGREYTFVRRGISSSAVKVFKDSSGQLTCRNENGMYRWDDEKTNEDIVNEKT